MRLERGLRSSSLKPYAVGHVAPPTDDVNRDIPHCQFGDVRDSGVWIGEQDYPAVIELGVCVTPLWADNKTAVATLDTNASCSLYPPLSVFSRVRIGTTGNGFYQKVSGETKTPFIGESFLNYQLDVPKPFLYQKDFRTQPEGQKIRWSTQDRSPQDGPVLWAYGAQQIGDDIHPLVFTLESVREETCLRVSSLLTWRERGIFPPTVGKVEPGHLMFRDVFEVDQTRSLKESLEAGMSVIYLKVGIDDFGNFLRIPYRSYRFMKNFIFYKKGE
jgi:hypothetical protein